MKTQDFKKLTLLLIVIGFTLFTISCKKDNHDTNQNSSQELIQATINGTVLTCYKEDFAKYFVNSHLADAVFYKDQIDGCEKNSFELTIQNFNIDSAKNCNNTLLPHSHTLHNATIRYRNEVNDSLFRDYYLTSGVNSNVTIDIITTDDFIFGHFTGKLYTKEYLHVCGPIIPNDNPIIDSLNVINGTYIIKLQRE